MVDEFVVREVGGLRVPLAAGPIEVADRIDNVTAWVDDRAATFGSRWDVRARTAHLASLVSGG